MSAGDTALLSQARSAFRPSLKCMTPRATCSQRRNGTSSCTAPSATYSSTKRATAAAYRMACLRAIGFARHPLHPNPCFLPAHAPPPLTSLLPPSNHATHTHTPSMHTPQPRVSTRLQLSLVSSRTSALYVPCDIHLNRRCTASCAAAVTTKTSGVRGWNHRRAACPSSSVPWTDCAQTMAVGRTSYACTLLPRLRQQRLRAEPVIDIKDVPDERLAWSARVSRRRYSQRTADGCLVRCSWINDIGCLQRFRRLIGPGQRNADSVCARPRRVRACSARPVRRAP